MSRNKNLLPWPAGVNVEVEFSDRLWPIHLEAMKNQAFKLRAVSGPISPSAKIKISGTDRDRIEEIVHCLRSSGYVNVEMVEAR